MSQRAKLINGPVLIIVQVAGSLDLRRTLRKTKRPLCKKALKG